ncbi:MAG: hypothetical protein RR009_05525 [Oscillospiraceae bacterium]
MKKQPQSNKNDMSSNKPRRIIVSALKAFIVILLVLAVPLVNYNIDPSKLYHTGREDSLEIQAVEILLDGKNVANLSNYNERLLHREYLRRIDTPFDTVVLGSSRGALITKEMLGTDNMFNLSVSGASIEDIIGTYGYLHMNNLVPHRLVISIDPWILNDNFGDARALEAFGDGYAHYLTTRIGADYTASYVPSGLYDINNTERTPLYKLSNSLKLNLFSISYFQTSLQQYFSGSYATYSKIIETSENSGTTGIVRADGSFSYPADYRNADEATIIMRAERSFPSSILGLENYENMNSKNRLLFEKFIQTVIEDGVQVEFLLEPLSPVIYDYMKTEERYSNFFKTQDMFTSLAEKYGVEYTGTFNPHAANLSIDDFYDGYHVKPECIATLIQPLNEES